MNRRPDWHPSYGREPSHQERVAAMRQRMNLPEPTYNYRRRHLIGLACMMTGIAVMGVSMKLAVAVQGIGIWVSWPIFRNPEYGHK